MRPPVLHESLTCPLLGAHARALQVRRLDEHGGGVQGVGRESVEAVLRQASRDGDLMLAFAGGCGGNTRGHFRNILVNLMFR